MNWQDKCEVIYHFRNDESILIVTKPEYRFDGCHAVVLDSKTAELALSNNANWKTISGAKVLIGKGGRIIAGMGGKYSNLKDLSTNKMVGKSMFSADSDSAKMLGETTTNEISSQIKGSIIEEVWAKNVNNVQIGSIENEGVSFYGPGDKKIYINKEALDNAQGRFGAYVHETAHAIDEAIGKRVYGMENVSYAANYKNQAFTKAIKNDVNNRVAAKQQQIRAEFEKIIKDNPTNIQETVIGLANKGYIAKDMSALIACEILLDRKMAPSVKKEDAYRAISYEIIALKDKGSTVSDLYSGVTKRKIQGRYMHEVKYMQQPGMLAVEGFAGMSAASACDRSQIAILEDFFPTAYGVYKEMIVAMKEL